MIQENKLYKIICYVHINVVLSLLFTFINFVTLGYMMLPGIMTLTEIADETKKGTIDIYTPIVRRYLANIKRNYKVKFAIFHSVLLLNVVGLIVSATYGLRIIQILNFSIIVAIATFYFLYSNSYNRGIESVEEILLYSVINFRVTLTLILVISIFIISSMSISILVFNSLLVFTYIYFINLLFNYSSKEG